MSQDLLDNSQEPTMDFWEQMEQAEKEGRSGGTVLQIEIAFVWKVFTTKADGFEMEETYFPYAIGNKESIKAARAKANQFVVANGLEKNPYNVFMIRLYKDTVLNREVSWENDRWFFLFPTSDMYTKIIAPKLRELEINKLGKYWSAVTWDEDKGGKPRTQEKRDADGNTLFDDNGDPQMETVYPLVAYPVQLFDTKEAALEFCGIEEKSDDAESVEVSIPMPEGYDDETWASTIKEIRAELGRGTKSTKIASDYGLPVSTIKQIEKTA